MLRLLNRRRSPSPPVAAVPLAAEAVAAPLAATPAGPASACALSTCVAGARATVLSVGCGDADACRLRALGLCEGASVSVVRSRDCTLLEVRGARLAVSPTIASGITVLPFPVA